MNDNEKVKVKSFLEVENITAETVEQLHVAYTKYVEYHHPMVHHMAFYYAFGAVFGAGGIFKTLFGGNTCLVKK